MVGVAGGGGGGKLPAISGISVTSAGTSTVPKRHLASPRSTKEAALRPVTVRAVPPRKGPPRGDIW
eukprot:scaffold20528_cov54-Phaeocystis_antarctica.AAC.5